jgi:hypothetical protein
MNVLDLVCLESLGNSSGLQRKHNNVPWHELAALNCAKRGTLCVMHTCPIAMLKYGKVITLCIKRLSCGTWHVRHVLHLRGVRGECRRHDDISLVMLGLCAISSESQLHTYTHARTHAHTHTHAHTRTHTHTHTHTHTKFCMDVKKF